MSEMTGEEIGTVLLPMTAQNASRIRYKKISAVAKGLCDTLAGGVA